MRAVFYIVTSKLSRKYGSSVLYFIYRVLYFKVYCCRSNLIENLFNYITLLIEFSHQI